MSDDSASIDTSAMSSDIAAAEAAVAADEAKQREAIIARAAQAMSGQAVGAVTERVAAMHDVAAAGATVITRTLATMQDQLNSMGLMLAQNRNALLTKREDLAAHEANYDAWEKQHVAAMRKTQDEITNLKARSEGTG